MGAFVNDDRDYLDWTKQYGATKTFKKVRKTLWSR